MQSTIYLNQILRKRNITKYISYFRILCRRRFPIRLSEFIVFIWFYCQSSIWSIFFFHFLHFSHSSMFCFFINKYTYYMRQFNNISIDGTECESIITPNWRYSHRTLRKIPQFAVCIFVLFWSFKKNEVHRRPSES